MKRTLALCLSLLLIAVTLPLGLTQAGAASFDDINQADVFVHQQTNYTCTLASAVMLVRRAAMLDGNADWRAVTESSMRPTAWNEGVGVWWNFTYVHFTLLLFWHNIYCKFCVYSISKFNVYRIPSYGFYCFF